MKQFLLLALCVMMTAGAGVLAATALSQGAATPTQTVTIDVATGPTGPPGPKGDQGEPGPPGTVECSAGSTLSDLVINAPGGQVTLTGVCVKD